MENQTVPARPGIEEVFRQYLLVLLGGRKQEVLADAIGVKRQGVGMILSGQRKIMPEHLVRLGDKWSISPRQMAADIARIALNMELGLAPGTGLRGAVVSEGTATGALAESTDRRPHDDDDAARAGG